MQRWSWSVLRAFVTTERHYWAILGAEQHVSASATPECCLFGKYWVKYRSKPVPVICSPRLPPARTTIFTATLAILDTKNIPQADPCAARWTIQNP